MAMAILTTISCCKNDDNTENGSDNDNHDNGEGTHNNNDNDNKDYGNDTAVAMTIKTIIATTMAMTFLLFMGQA